MHRIVTDYNGRIDVQSAVGRGTTIVARFPAPPGVRRSSAGAGRRLKQTMADAAPPHKPRILVVDDERSLREMLSIVLGREGYDVATAEDVGSALDQIRRGRLPDVLISDLRMPDGSGVDVLRALKERSPNSVGLLLTAFASADTAVEAMRLGAVDYLTKPFDVADLKQRIARYLEVKRLNETQTTPAEGRKSPGVRARRPQPRRSSTSSAWSPGWPAPTPASSSPASRAPARSGRRARSTCSRAAKRQPFVAVNCGAFTESILESELFGHMKGSFTGAVDTKKGLLEVGRPRHAVPRRGRGDEPWHAGEAAARAAGAPFPAGRGHPGTRSRRPLHRRHQSQPRGDGARRHFREDFFFRINVISVRLPALRERAEDVPILAEQFVHRFAERMGRPVRSIHADAMRAAHGLPLARQRARA